MYQILLFILCRHLLHLYFSSSFISQKELLKIALGRLFLNIVQISLISLKPTIDNHCLCFISRYFQCESVVAREGSAEESSDDSVVKQNCSDDLDYDSSFYSQIEFYPMKVNLHW